MTIADTTEQTEATTHTVTLPALEAYDAFRFVHAAAKSADKITPAIRAVRIEPIEGGVTLTATDRYRVHQANVRVVATDNQETTFGRTPVFSVTAVTEGEGIIIPEEAVAWIIKNARTFKPARYMRADAGLPTLTIEWTDGDTKPQPVTITVKESEVSTSRVETITHTVEGHYPPVARLFPDYESEGTPDLAPFIAINPAFLADLALMPRDRNAPVRIHSPRAAAPAGKWLPILIESPQSTSRALIQPNLMLR